MALCPWRELNAFVFCVVGVLHYATVHRLLSVNLPFIWLSPRIKYRVLFGNIRLDS